MTNNDIDNKVAEYLSRAEDVIRLHPGTFPIELTDQNQIEIAKMIQREELAQPINFHPQKGYYRGNDNDTSQV